MWEPGQGWPVLGQILIFQKPETPTLAPLKQSSHIVRSNMFPEEAKRLQRSRTKVDEDVEGGPEGLVLATSWSAGHFIPSVVLSYSLCFVDSCCPVGWLQEQKRCFYISYTPRSFEESQKYCTSLSSKLAVFREPEKYYYYYVSMPLSIF